MKRLILAVLFCGGSIRTSYALDDWEQILIFKYGGRDIGVRIEITVPERASFFSWPNTLEEGYGYWSVKEGFLIEKTPTAVNRWPIATSFVPPSVQEWFRDSFGQILDHQVDWMRYFLGNDRNMHVKLQSSRAFGGFTKAWGGRVDLLEFQLRNYDQESRYYKPVEGKVMMQAGVRNPFEYFAYFYGDEYR